MQKTLFRISVLSVIFLSLSTSYLTTAFAQEYDFFPRLSVNTSNNPSKSLLGNYLYVGTAIQKAKGGELMIDGPSIKLGISKTGQKINIGWLKGNAFFSYEAGISYFNQDINSSLLINPDGKGLALEGSIRFGIGIMNGIIAQDAMSLEFGLGF